MDRMLKWCLVAAVAGSGWELKQLKGRVDALTADNAALWEQAQKQADEPRCDPDEIDRLKDDVDTLDARVGDLEP